MNELQLFALIRTLTAKLEAAKRGLGLANKLGIKKHKSRIMGTMNRLRAALNKAKQALSAILP